MAPPLARPARGPVFVASSALHVARARMCGFAATFLRSRRASQDITFSGNRCNPKQPGVRARLLVHGLPKRIPERAKTWGFASSHSHSITFHVRMPHAPYQSITITLARQTTLAAGVASRLTSNAHGFHPRTQRGLPERCRLVPAWSRGQRQRQSTSSAQQTTPFPRTTRTRYACAPRRGAAVRWTASSARE